MNVLQAVVTPAVAGKHISRNDAANVIPIDTPLAQAGVWLRVLKSTAWTVLTTEDAPARRQIVEMALGAVRAWGSPEMKREARKHARRALAICDLADVGRPDAPVYDLAAFRAKRAGGAS